MITSETNIDVCNELLRGEISAVETYTQAIEKFGAADEEDMLARIRADHKESAQELRRLVEEAGGKPAQGSGTWGGFAKAVEVAAVLLGETPALKVLQEGEEKGLKEYRDALADPAVSPAVKELIRDELIPALNDHVIELQRRRGRAA